MDKDWKGPDRMNRMGRMNRIKCIDPFIRAIPIILNILFPLPVLS
jgi:hypothetical protein